jgi:hypothetical protein
VAVEVGVAPLHAPSSRHQLSVGGFHGFGGQSRLAAIVPMAVYFRPSNVTDCPIAYAVQYWNAGTPVQMPPEVGVDVGVEVGVLVAVFVAVAVAVARGVFVGVFVAVFVAVLVARGVFVGVPVAVFVAVAVGVGPPPFSVNQLMFE